MKKPSEHSDEVRWEELRERIIGLGERSFRKSYYPELKARMADLERFRALLDQSSDAILLVEVAGSRVADANQAACRMLGCALPNLVGRSLETLAPAIAERTGRRAESEVASPERLSTTLPGALAGATPVDVAVSFVAFGEERYAVAVARDVAERRRAEAALRASERRLRAIFEGAAIGMAVASPDGRLLESNAVLQELVGLSGAALRGKSVLSLLDPADADQTGQELAALVEGRSGEYVRLEKRLLGAAGQVLWALLDASLVRDGGGAPDYLVLALQDIGPRKRAEEALQFLARAGVQLSSSLSVQETLRTLGALAVPRLGELCAVYLRAADGAFERCELQCASASKQRLAAHLQEGWPRPTGKELGVRGVLEGGAARLMPELPGTLLADSAREPAQLALWRALEPRTAMAVPLVGQSGLLGALLLARLEPNRSAEGRSSGGPLVRGLERLGRPYDELDLELAQQFAGRAALALENARLYREAQESSRLKDEFLAIVSHELRTPLTSVLGWAWMLGARERVPVARAAQAITRSAQALARIIDDLLDVSSMVAGRLHLSRAPIDLAPLIEAAVESLRPEAVQRELTMTVRCQGDLPKVLGDAQRLQQVIWNLVSNAAKYTPPGGSVEVSLERGAGGAQLEVRDSGIGISAQFLPRVFDGFRQADSSSTRACGGLGLGLTIVERLVGLHGGVVRARSAGLGRGATFTVCLPFHEEAEPRPLLADGAEVPRLDGLRLLLVEDDQDGRELLAELLRSRGAHVAAAASVREALAALERERPDVVLSDIAMPEEGGFDLLEELRQRGLGIPCVALTALAREEDRLRSLAAGFERHLTKPVEPGALFLAVKELLRRRDGPLRVPHG
jgi:PAS domain S-box-containing protein